MAVVSVVLFLFPPTSSREKHTLDFLGVGESKCYRFCVGRELEEGRKLQDMGTLGEFA